tara:strand:- start:2561 stop:2686 length:126 start_codon:yes stop_codon:yes gene_type:complete
MAVLLLLNSEFESLYEYIRYFEISFKKENFKAVLKKLRGGY